MTTLVLYVFHEFNNRVHYFLKNAIFQDDKVDFLIICNNTEITFDVPEYVKVLKRNNIGYDFGVGLMDYFKMNYIKNMIHLFLLTLQYWDHLFLPIF